MLPQENMNELFSITAARKSKWSDLTKWSDSRGILLYPFRGAYNSTLNELEIVVLDGKLIRYANSYAELQSVCPRVTSLDLSRNLFSSLSTVAEICRPLTILRTLRLTGNRFSSIALCQELSDAFVNVEWLALNMCALCWSEVCSPCFQSNSRLRVF